MKKDVLLELAGRCESITAASGFEIWEVNGDIAEALGLAPNNARRGEGDAKDRWIRSGYIAFQAPHYATSVDAASSLMPTIPFAELRPGQWWWQVDNLGCYAHVAYENHDSGIPEYQGEATTPALALCAAALRARADML